MKSSSRLLTLLSVVLVAIVILNALPFIQRGWASFVASTIAANSTANLTVSGQQWGSSTCYIGATEGSSRFDIADLEDLGINAYHIYGGMSRWEAHDDSSHYGYPTIAQIKANPGVINWKWWDAIMTSPPDGSDYWWEPSPRWHGNARALFSPLQSAHIRIVLDLRNRDDQHQPTWSPDPPQTTADWNEWWEHVFATVYWLDVRNNYGVADFEVQNEPNIPGQGWSPEANETEYYTFVKYTDDAISYVFHTYLPGHNFHVLAPATSGGSWPGDMLQHIPQYFDSVDIHSYSYSPSIVEETHIWMNQTGYAKDPLWVTEWGSFKEHQYDSEPFGVDLINEMIYGSYPGNDYIYGSAIFALYDYSRNPTGLIDYNGYRRVDYYAMRMGIRALQGCRPTYITTTSDSHLLAITSVDSSKNIYLLITNQNSKISYTIHANFSALLTGASGIMWQFDNRHLDTIVGKPSLENGHLTLTVPASGAVLVKFLH